MYEWPSSNPSKPAPVWAFRHGVPSVTAEKGLVATVVAIALVSALFTAQPELDLAFSRLFFDGSRFWLADNRYLQNLRWLTDWLGAAILGWTVLLLCWPALRARIGRRPRDLLVPIIAYGVGVGLIVNVFLKEYFGRARPREVMEFSGDSIFTAAWQFSDACQTNCSFTSGEAAGAMAIYSVMAIIPVISHARRIILATILGGITVVLSLNRIAFGGHFLSDVLLSILFVLALMLATRVVLKGRLGTVIDRITIGNEQNRKAIG